jgi:hypothetical protein
MTQHRPDGLTWEKCLEESLSLVDNLLGSSTADPVLINQLAELLEQLHRLLGKEPREEPARAAELNILLRCVREVEKQAREQLDEMRNRLEDDGKRRMLLKSLKATSR